MALLTKLNLARQFGPLRHPLQLTADGLVLDPGVVHEQEILAEDHRQKVIAFKRQGKPRGRIPRAFDDAQVAVPGSMMTLPLPKWMRC